MTEPDHYKILGVPPTADHAQIRQAYRRGVRDTHPDAGGDPERFHALQTAYETLADPTTRSEYDTSRGIKRPLWRGPGKHAKQRRVKAWRVNTTVTRQPSTSTDAAKTDGPGDIITRPWFTDIDPNRRLRCAPSVWRRATATAATATVWLLTGYLLATTVLGGAGNPALRAFVVPYLLLNAATVVTASVRTLRRRRPVPEALACAFALAVVWVGDFAPAALLLGAHLAISAATPWIALRLRIAIRLRNAVRTVLHDFNAFGPAGVRPSADRRTGAVLRALLERIPAARLFVRVPVGTHHAEYTVVCGRKVAVITPPIPRTVDDVTTEDLPDAVDNVASLLAGTQVRGFVVWPNLPVDRISGTDATIRHLSAPDAASEIGRWLAEEPYTLHLPTLRRLRDRLAHPDNPSRSSVHA